MSFFRLLFGLVFFSMICAGGLALLALAHFAEKLPDHRTLRAYSPPVMSRVYADDGRVLTRFAEQERLFVTIDRMPKLLVQAFISAEDKKFFHHQGIDPVGIFRAALQNLREGGARSGGSTITQQVVKNFLLTNEKTITRKVKEAILAVRISKEFTKEKILELYLNEIYLGSGAYGVVAAGLEYFNKPVDELRLEECALLAALPKAPSEIDPRKFYDRAKERRNFVLRRMLEDGYITEAEAILAMSRPIQLSHAKTAAELVNGTYFTDSVRADVVNRYSESKLLKDGLSIWSTLNPDFQRIAERAVKNGLVEYDRRHGWRGPVGKIDLKSADAQAKFANTIYASSSWGWVPVLVKSVHDTKADVVTRDGKPGQITLESVKWAKKFINRNAQGPAPKSVRNVISPGDVVFASPVQDGGGPGSTGENKKEIQGPLRKPEENAEGAPAKYELQQVPQVQGSLVAMDPHTGKVLALVGGFDYNVNQYNRAVQAKRQPGSSIKPFVYLSALENGFMPNSIVVDGEIVLPRGNGKLWRPQNHSGKFYGPRTLRFGIEQSLNALTVRLATLTGPKRVAELIHRFGVTKEVVKNLSVVLGTSESTNLQMTTAYSMLVNGGKQISPNLIEWIQDRNGRVITRRDERSCLGCTWERPNFDGMYPPVLGDQGKQVTDPVRAYQMVSMLMGVVERGTAKKAKELPFPVAGKTGTTNDTYDAWFVGFTPNLALGVYTGFDSPGSLGKHEYGSTVALPIWMEFAKNALKDKPAVPFRRPDGVKLVRLNYITGQPPAPWSENDARVIWEAFKTKDNPFGHWGFGSPPEEEEEEEQPPADAPTEQPAPSADGQAPAEGETQGSEPQPEENAPPLNAIPARDESATEGEPDAESAPAANASDVGTEDATQPPLAPQSAEQEGVAPEVVAEPSPPPIPAPSVAAPTSETEMRPPVPSAAPRQSIVIKTIPAKPVEDEPLRPAPSPAPRVFTPKRERPADAGPAPAPVRAQAEPFTPPVVSPQRPAAPKPSTPASPKLAPPAQAAPPPAKPAARQEEPSEERPKRAPAHKAPVREEDIYSGGLY